MAPEENATAARMLWSAATGMVVAKTGGPGPYPCRPGSFGKPFREVRLASEPPAGFFKACPDTLTMSGLRPRSGGTISPTSPGGRTGPRWSSSCSSAPSASSRSSRPGALGNRRSTARRSSSWSSVGSPIGRFRPLIIDSSNGTPAACISGPSYCFCPSRSARWPRRTSATSSAASTGRVAGWISGRSRSSPPSSRRSARSSSWPRCWRALRLAPFGRLGAPWRAPSGSRRSRLS